MKGLALLSALAAAGVVSGSPTKRADPTPITIKGNGKRQIQSPRQAMPSPLAN